MNGNNTIAALTEKELADLVRTCEREPDSLFSLSHRVAQLRRTHPDAVARIIRLRPSSEEHAKAHCQFVLNLASQDAAQAALIVQAIFSALWEECLWTAVRAKLVVRLISLAPSSSSVVMQAMQSHFPHPVRPTEHLRNYTCGLLEMVRQGQSVRWLQGFVYDLLFSKMVLMDKPFAPTAHTFPEQVEQSDEEQQQFAKPTDDDVKPQALLHSFHQHFIEMTFDLQFACNVLQSFEKRVLPNTSLCYTPRIVFDACCIWPVLGERLLGFLFNDLFKNNSDTAAIYIASFGAELPVVAVDKVLRLLELSSNPASKAALLHITKHRHLSYEPSSLNGSLPVYCTQIPRLSTSPAGEHFDSLSCRPLTPP